MGWTPLFLEMRDKKVLVVGAGEVGERRAKRFLKAGAHVVILGNTASEEIIDLGASLKSIDNASKWVEWSDLVVIATGDHNLNEEIAHLADYKLVNRADYPQKGNLIVPTSFFIEDVQICVFTGGKSPLMAKQLRKKIQKVIKNEDILQLELQDFTRKLLKDKVKDQKDRRSYLYKILNDKTVEKLLKDGNLNQAKVYVEELLLNLNKEV
ncbi:precorrin-2 dehydrogenase/sirohydrochlorin ferrochelatase family protein [Methanobacterium paludis]|uniref:precorrin-2 dehydrogenase n=1 Tax=Methanobacterium paludis (strain DSM 25820 / JCM 18151 / SWAN1) TaxID=868131 RepID=F6D1L9_METPW|nr:bifunctional precorrin-2 dehydrogenase/sirohydrochlorin ferrochelatase [Methanobacterium paludis]AEG17247.1 siroheme synthase [Methanobacterium paludis]